MNILRTIIILKLVKDNSSYPFTRIITTAKIMNMAVAISIMLQWLEFSFAQFVGCMFVCM